MVLRREDAVREAGVEVAFSDLPHADGSPRLFWLRTSLMPRFLAVARAMNGRGWVKVEDAYRTPAMQRALGTRPALFAAILEKVRPVICGLRLWLPCT